MYLIKYNYILCFAILSCTSGISTVSKFRADYTYSAKTGNYFKVHKKEINWHDAVAKCTSEGAQLFYPVDEAEAKEANSLFNLTLSEVDPIWIGVSDLRSDRVFETIDGRPFDEVYNKWDTAFGQPAKKDYGVHCVIMWDDLGLWLYMCSDRNSFICKYDPRRSQENDIRKQPTTVSQLENMDWNMETSTMDKTPVSMNGAYLSIDEDIGGDGNHTTEKEWDDQMMERSHGHVINLKSFTHFISSIFLLITNMIYYNF